MFVEKNIYSKKKSLKTYVLSVINILENILLPLLLFIRLWMERIFWRSGLSKISDWPATLYLFENEYKVPLISSKIAAYLSAITELPRLPY